MENLNKFKIFQIYNQILIILNSGTVSLDDLYFNENEILLGKSRAKDEELTEFHKDMEPIHQKLRGGIFNIVNTLTININQNLCIAGGCGMNCC